MPRYDRTMKRLTTAFTKDYVRLALGADPQYAEPVAIEELDKELPALSREVDFVARVRLEDQDAVLLLEFQTAWAADMPQRMAGYCWRLYERYHEPVYPVVVVLRPGGDLQCQWRMHAWGRLVASCQFQVLPLWRMDASTVMEQGWVGLYPLLPLMQWPQAEPRQVLEQSQQLILEQISEREQRADAYVALRVLSGIAYPEVLIEQILRRQELMLESPVYRKIMDEGREEGLEQGLEAGRQQGRHEGEHSGRCAAVLAVLEVRFGELPESLPRLIADVTDATRLEALHRRAVVVESLEVFVHELEQG
jgi:predicted transposase YdaD